MKFGTRSFFALTVAVLFVACKKENPTTVESDFKVFDFSVVKSDVTADGAFLLTGSDFVTKVDVDGNVVWNKDHYLSDFALSTKSNGIVSCKNKGSYLLMERMDAQGVVTSSKSLFMSDSSGMAGPRAVELSSGELFFFSPNSSDSTLSIMKTGSSGTMQWNTKIKLNMKMSSVNKVIEGSANGDILIVGNTPLSSTAKVAMCIIKIDSSGAILWQQQKVFGIWENYPTDIHKTTAGDYIITGHYDASKTADYNYQFFVYKLNDAGDSLDFYATGGSKQDYCISSVLDESNNSILLIGMEGRGKNNLDLSLSNIKLVTINTGLSAELANDTYAELQACSGLNVIYNSDGSLSLIGKKYAYDNLNIEQTFFMKIKPDGNL